MKTNFNDLARGFAMFSDETRLSILRMLAKGPQNVTKLCKALKLKQPTVSHHLGLLRMSRIAIGTRHGKEVLYTLDKAEIQALGASLKTLGGK
jgi:arsenate reductase (thioredoxin)